MKYLNVRRLLVALLTATLALVTFAPPASAASWASVDFTVNEALPIGTPGTISDSDLSECAAGTVTTPTVDVNELGRVTVYVGTKVLDCGDGNSLTIGFAAAGSECNATNRGLWWVTGGTGVYDGARGGGRLVGTYVAADGGPGDFCDNAGVDDRYTGRIRIAG